ncbi:unnamed protein product [Effrenium voratum]|nr:unnamed protein product [Effrenium voratum]
MAPWLRGAVAGLAAPQLLGSVADGRTHLRVPVSQELSLDLLEASLSEQEQLVEEALEEPTDGAESDPYGLVLWPAAQVAAAALVALLKARAPAEKRGSKRRILELGCGTGLCSLAAAAESSGAEVVATDYRAEPLELLQQARHLNERRLGRRLAIRCQNLDFVNQRLPAADFVVAADLLYLRSTSEALAKGCLEALKGGAQVLVGDTGRPGRGAFLRRLQRELKVQVDFEQLHGWSLALPRHELIARQAPEPRPLPVGLMHLRPQDLA